ncbi:MAG: ATP-binding cassette domain-containing protein [Magnetococcales bacterium]|nr:ATP-binding cassette domain-containing protein [Magnetococcales bacterium]
MSRVIEISGLLKKYAGETVVDRIDFDVQEGECFGILGPNGAGKSTTLRMIIGLTPKDAGELTVFGLPMSPEQKGVPPLLGVVPQEDNLDVDLSVAENLLVHGRYFGLSTSILKEKTQALLEFAQLTKQADQPVRQLSGGMKRRLVIARSLVADPKLVVLDEPTTGLDPQARHMIWQRLRQLRESGVTLLLTTHYMEEAAQICDRILILNHGKILDLDTPTALIERHVEPEVIEIRGNGAKPDPSRFENLPCRVEPIGDTLYCYTHRSCDVLEPLRDEQHHLTFLHRPANLEDVFLKLTGRELRD